MMTLAQANGLRIIPLADVFDLLIGIGLILLGLSIQAVIIAIIICNFRKGGNR